MKTGSDHFLEFGWFDMADIAYSDKQKRCSITMGNAHAGKGHLLCTISIIYAKNS